MIERVIDAMKQVFKLMPAGIDHTFHVLDYAKAIMDGEEITEVEQEVVIVAAILHDIGLVEAKQKYGSMEGPYQEKEGAIIARHILESLDCQPTLIDRVSYIVGHHHTPSMINGLDFEVLWDADLLENLKSMEVCNDVEKLSGFIEENFRTASGKAMAYQIY